jgi:hypothetical protein
MVSPPIKAEDLEGKIKELVEKKEKWEKDGGVELEREKEELMRLVE